MGKRNDIEVEFPKFLEVVDRTETIFENFDTDARNHHVNQN